MPTFDLTDDTLRNKSIELIYKSLHGQNSFAEDQEPDLTSISQRIESQLHTLHPASSTYKLSIRSHAQNLKNPSSPLRSLLLSGQLTPERFAEMDSEEMASPERREEKERLRRDSLVGSIGPGLLGVEEMVREKLVGSHAGEGEGGIGGRETMIWSGADTDKREGLVG